MFPVQPEECPLGESPVVFENAGDADWLFTRVDAFDLTTKILDFHF